MRPLPRNRKTNFQPGRAHAGIHAEVAFLGLLAAGIFTQGCGGGGAGSAALPPPPPPSPAISITVTPTNAAVVLGSPQAFTAALTNTNDSSISWSVNGVT